MCVCVGEREVEGMVVVVVVVMNAVLEVVK